MMRLEAWAICRIFKKANSSTQRALSHSWISPSFDQTTTTTTTTSHHAINNPPNLTNFHFNSSNTPLQFDFSNDHVIQQSSFSNFSPLHFPPNNQFSYKIPDQTFEAPPKHAVQDASSLLLEMSTSIFGLKGSEDVEFSALNEQCNGFSMQENAPGVKDGDQNVGEFEDDEWGVIRSFPMSLSEACLLWDSSSNCPSELSTCYSTNNCYTN
ncbi:hypothetical protein ACS0TY_008915 [Phlomoides rotata]